MTAPDVASIPRAVEDLSPARSGPPELADGLLRCVALGTPVEARRCGRPRSPLVAGIRRTEHEVSQFLSRRVFPWIPGLRVPYDWQLRHRLELSWADVPIADLPVGFAGLRLLLITDLHAGPFVSPEALGEVLARLMRLEPDLVLVGGDLATCTVAEIDPHGAALRALRAPLGVHAVLGNHDHATRDTAGLVARVESLGIAVLSNRSVRLERNGSHLSLAGVDDLERGRPDLERALEGTTSPVILLSHHPDLLFDAAERGVALMLSGHTHGGQIVLPGGRLLIQQSRHRLFAGRFRCARTELVVSRGLGVVGLPLRIGSPPEAILLTLRRA